MSKVTDTLKDGTRAMARVFGAEDTVPRSSQRKKKDRENALKARRQATQFVPDDDALGAARRRTVDRQRARGGRISTILSDGNDRLGG